MNWKSKMSYRLKIWNIPKYSMVQNCYQQPNLLTFPFVHCSHFQTIKHQIHIASKQHHDWKHFRRTNAHKIVAHWHCRNAETTQFNSFNKCVWRTILNEKLVDHQWMVNNCRKQEKKKCSFWMQISDQNCISNIECLQLICACVEIMMNVCAHRLRSAILEL